MNEAKLYLIPTPLAPGDPARVLPECTREAISQLDCFVVEDLRSARRFLSAAGHKGHVETLELHELSEHTTTQEVSALMTLFQGGRSVGLLSEAGLPAVADPGSALVALCQQNGVEVIPLVGPSSLLMALMASGLNGQSFHFVGYIPVKEAARKAALKALERQSSVEGHSAQILIETPYRGDALLSDMLSTLSGKTRLCLAVNLTAPDQSIRTKTVEQWRRAVPTLGKKPCVFILEG